MLQLRSQRFLFSRNWASQGVEVQLILELIQIQWVNKADVWLFSHFQIERLTLARFQLDFLIFNSSFTSLNSSSSSSESNNDKPYFYCIIPHQIMWIVTRSSRGIIGKENFSFAKHRYTKCRSCSSQKLWILSNSGFIACVEMAFSAFDKCRDDPFAKIPVLTFHWAFKRRPPKNPH